MRRMLTAALGHTPGGQTAPCRLDASDHPSRRSPLRSRPNCVQSSRRSWPVCQTRSWPHGRPASCRQKTPSPQKIRTSSKERSRRGWSRSTKLRRDLQLIPHSRCRRRPAAETRGTCGLSLASHVLSAAARHRIRIISASQSRVLSGAKSAMNSLCLSAGLTIVLFTTPVMNGRSGTIRESIRCRSHGAYGTSTRDHHRFDRCLTTTSTSSARRLRPRFFGEFHAEAYSRPEAFLCQGAEA